MSFIKSALFGNEGSYKFFGIDVSFEKEPPKISSRSFPIILDRYIKVINCILRSRGFAVLTLHRLHTLIHEMGHLVLGLKVLKAERAKLIIFKDISLGMPSAVTMIKIGKLTEREDSFYAAAGPMASMAFSSCELMLAAAMRKHCTIPSYIMGSGAFLNISNELLYAAISIIRFYRMKDEHPNESLGDFGDIARNGKKHLALASLVLISECALGIFGAYKLL